MFLEEKNSWIFIRTVTFVVFSLVLSPFPLLSSAVILKTNSLTITEAMKTRSLPSTHVGSSELSQKPHCQEIIIIWLVCSSLENLFLQGLSFFNLTLLIQWKQSFPQTVWQLFNVTDAWGGDNSWGKEADQ